jgi:hypothetical protein
MRQDIHARGQGQERLSSAIATTSFAVFCRTAQNGQNIGSVWPRTTMLRTFS